MALRPCPSAWSGIEYECALVCATVAQHIGHYLSPPPMVDHDEEFYGSRRRRPKNFFEEAGKILLCDGLAAALL